MAARIENFGEDRDGTGVLRIHLAGGGLSAGVLTWGAVVQDLRLDGHQPPLVLGFDRFDPYPAHSPYFGAIVGRYANRIADARFELDGAAHRLDANFLGRHILHGGSHGIGRRHWAIADAGTSHAVLVCEDGDGEMGFPGNCRHTCSYTLKEGGVLQIALTSMTDAPTVASLAPHSYFILDDSGDSRSHVLQIDADYYLPVDGDLIPTGEIAPVDGTPFDFRRMRYPGEEGVIDHNFCLSRERRSLRRVAQLRSDLSGVTLDIATTEPGLQIYTGSKIATPVAGLTGPPYGAFAGMAIEPQNWPDAPNRADFPDPVLRPGEPLRQVSEFRFTSGG